MNFVNHYRLKDKHAFLGASKYNWINYDEDKLIHAFKVSEAAKRGTELHEFAASCIKLKQRLPNEAKTINMYVNDGIGFNMTPEQTLYYSDNCFGTADAISFRNNELRIHDYKSGTSTAHIEQLIVYAALFCLEYDYNPNDIFIELRIYQNNDILSYNPTIEDVAPIMDKIIYFDKVINELKIDGGLR